MRLILDAGAAVEVALDRAKAPEFAKLLGAAGEVLAPELLVPEVINTVWKYHQFEKLSLIACDRAIELGPCPGRRPGLVQGAPPRSSQRPAYDAFYLALAQREDAALLTMDAALRKRSVAPGNPDTPIVHGALWGRLSTCGPISNRSSPSGPGRSSRHSPPRADSPISQFVCRKATSPTAKIIGNLHAVLHQVQENCNHKGHGHKLYG